MIARREAHEEGALPAATEMGLEAGAAGRAKTSTATAPRGGHIAVNPCACACSMCGGNACNVTAGVQGSGMTRRGAAHGSVVVRFCTHLNVDEMEDHHCSGCAAGREDQVHRVELERNHRDPDRSCGGGKRRRENGTPLNRILSIRRDFIKYGKKSDEATANSIPF
jgi:hypothetical protein